MPYKKKYATRKSRKGKNRRQKKPRNGRSTNFEKRVADKVMDKLQTDKETKYLNPSLASFETITREDTRIDSLNQRGLIDITPQILEGDTYASRDGDTIQMMGLQIRMRVNSIIREFTHSQGGGAMAHSLLPQIKYVNCHLIRLDKTSAITAGELDYCIRRPQENWMDTRQTSERSHKKEFSVLKSFKIPVDYDNRVGVDTSAGQWLITSFPKISYVNQICKLNKKTFFNASSSNKPVKYEYKLFFTWGGWFRNAFIDIDFPSIQLWSTWTFKDL